MPHRVQTEAGMRALTFVHNVTRRVLVAFRGTDLGLSKPSSIADKCADAMLWDGRTFQHLPPPCKAFTLEQLNYFARAIDFSHSVAEAFPHYDLAYTGHSLGAGLALLVAASAESCSPPSAGAVVFSSPPFIDALRNRTSVNLYDNATTHRNAHRLITFADAFDPLLFENNRTARGLAGRVCVLGASNPEPLSCSTCFAHSCPSSRSYPCRINITEPACNLCFRLRHVYGHYFHDDIPLAENAVCSIRTPCQASENACAPLGVSCHREK